MGNSKWIADLAPDMPAVEAARHVVIVRLQPVVDLIPLAAEQADQDVGPPLNQTTSDHLDEIEAGIERIIGTSGKVVTYRNAPCGEFPLGTVGVEFPRKSRHRVKGYPACSYAAGET